MDNAKIIAVGCDHGGYDLKNTIIKLLTDKGYTVNDLGTYGTESVDYPVYASKVCDAVTSGEAPLGILVCGTGIGMSIAANKHRGIRAALCSDVFSAKMTRAHNDANVLCLGARVIGPGLACEIVKAFLSSSFEGGRHSKRVEMLEQ